MRAVSLGPVKAGMTRLRDKGGASPESLYDLKNGYIDASRAPTSRPGTTLDATLPDGTKGLCYFDGQFVVFGHEDPGAMPDGYTCAILRHPSNANIPIARIHFAMPFLGYLYVVAEFASGEVYHYWTQSATQWAADTVHKPGDLVEPSTPNGFLYRAVRTAEAYPAWTANTARTEGDKIEPTVANGYYYEATDVSTGGASGTTEPEWPETEDAVVYEFAGGNPAAPSTPTTPSDPSGGGTPPRYCVVWDSRMDDGTLAIDAHTGDVHDCWKPEEGFTRQAIVAVGAPEWVSCVRLTLSDGSVLRCSRTTPFTNPYTVVDSQDWLAPDMLGRHAFNGDRAPLEVVSVEDIGLHWVVPIDFGGRSFPAGDVGLVWSHNINKKSTQYTELG